MHPHLIDWFRNVHIHPDSSVVEKRWKTAQKYADTLDVSSICSLLRIFLFSKIDQAEKEGFEKSLLLLDKEFPIAGNAEELRLMAGVVMVATFEEGTRLGDAFALGIRAASMCGRRLDPVQPEIVAESAKYLQVEAERQRPIDFNERPLTPNSALSDLFKAIRGAGDDDEALEAAESAYQNELESLIQTSHDILGKQIRRLAEESALLWWVVNEYSSSLDCRTSELAASEYAIVAATEAAERTHLLPPPRSAKALLTRALKPCKKKATATFTLEQLLSATPASSRNSLVKTLRLEHCKDLVPLLTGLIKTEEFGSATAAAQVLEKLSQGFDSSYLLSPPQAAFCAYCELMFIKALNATAED